MADKPPARASLRYAKAPLSPRYRWKLHHTLGHCPWACVSVQDRGLRHPMNHDLIALGIRLLKHALTLWENHYRSIALLQRPAHQ